MKRKLKPKLKKLILALTRNPVVYKQDDNIDFVKSQGLDKKHFPSRIQT